MQMNKAEKWLLNSPIWDRRAHKPALKLLPRVPMAGMKNLLDVGCGNGQAAIYTARTYPLAVTGLDLDPMLLARARREGAGIPNLDFIEADASRMPFPDAHFDIVMTFFALHHMENWNQAQQELLRVLRPGGYLVSAEMVVPRFIAMHMAMVHQHGATTGHGLTTREEWAHFFKAQGLTVIYSAFSRYLLMNRFDVVCRKP
jgi:ubiquinone/menaquinone biosynthesis C-methylase UbiE